MLEQEDAEVLLLVAWLFGSVARGDSDVDSDVDLLIVADDLSSASRRKLVSARNPLVEQIRLERIALTGDAGSLLERHR